MRHVSTMGEAPAHERAQDVARSLGRPVGRNGGMRDFSQGPHSTRCAYVTVAVRRSDCEMLKREAAERGLSVSAFLGAMVEGALLLPRREFDRLLANGKDA